MAIYCDTGVFCLSITGTENFQYHPLLGNHTQKTPKLPPKLALPACQPHPVIIHTSCPQDVPYYECMYVGSIIKCCRLQLYHLKQ